MSNEIRLTISSCLLEPKDLAKSMTVLLPSVCPSTQYTIEAVADAETASLTGADSAVTLTLIGASASVIAAIINLVASCCRAGKAGGTRSSQIRMELCIISEKHCRKATITGTETLTTSHLEPLDAREVSISVRVSSQE